MGKYRDLVFENLKKIKFSNIFHDNKLVFIFSVLVSFILWITINVNRSDSTPVTVSGIPISVNLSESAIKDGLRIFSGQDIKVNADITGNRLIVGQVTKDDIQITAQQASTITSPGTYTLELTAKKIGLLSDYEIVSSLQPAFITIMVDRYREAEFDIEPDVKFSVDPSYFLGATVLSSQKVVLSGPELEISKIKKVLVKREIEGELKSTLTTKIPISMYDSYGEQIVSENISATVKDVDVTIPVLMKKSVKINPNFKNVPKGIDLSNNLVKVEPSLLEIAGPEDQIKEMDKIELDEIDFKNLDTQHNKFNLPINLPSGCKSLNNVYESKISVNTSGFREKSFWVKQISILNKPDDKEAKIFTDGIEVKIVGSYWSIKNLDSENIFIELDLGNRQDLNGAMEFPANIVIKDHDDVWAYGDYTINIEIY